MSDKGEIKIEEIIEMLKDYIGDDVEITEDTELFSDLGLTSFDAVTLMEAIAQKYDVEVEMTEVMNFKTVGDIVECLK